MNLIKWMPNKSTLSVFNEFDSIYNRIVNIDNYKYNSWSPSFNVTECDKKFVVYADLPGVDKENISVDLEDGVIKISGERMVKYDNLNTYFTNHTAGKFSRSFNLPDNCNADDISAKLENGVLELSIPKVEKVRDIKKIAIK